MQWIKSKPRTIAKDFYIWQYLDQDITPEQAIEALGQARSVNYKLLSKYAKKLKHKETSEVISCRRLSGTKLINKSADCIALGMSTYKATKLNTDQLEQAINNLDNKYPDTINRLKILNSTIPFTKLVSSKKEIFFDTFNQCGSKYRIDKFNYPLPQSTINRLLDDKKFETTLKLIVTTPSLYKLQKSILNIKYQANQLSHLSLFYLALNAIIYEKKELALKYLNDSNKKAYYRFDKDKVLFWKYKLTNDKQILEKLSKSWDTNIYSLIALEKLNKKPQNIFYTIDQKNDKKDIYFDTTSPFSWFPILNNSRKMDEKIFNQYKNVLVEPKTLPHLAFISERYYRYKNSYFITPYEDILNGIGTNRKALIYALARQESRFIPTSISTAYAMGTMQIMPFLSKSIAKELKEFYNIYDQLNPDTNLRYANHHLNFLEERLKHPLLISYAYNGGIGFTKRIVLKRYFNNKFDPYLSMELLPYNETRKYGKKVLANYYIYSNHLGMKVTFEQLFKQLVVDNKI